MSKPTIYFKSCKSLIIPRVMYGLTNFQCGIGNDGEHAYPNRQACAASRISSLYLYAPPLRAVW